MPGPRDRHGRRRRVEYRYRDQASGQRSGVPGRLHHQYQSGVGPCRAAGAPGRRLDRLAALRDGGPTGGLFNDDRPVPW